MDLNLDELSMPSSDDDHWMDEEKFAEKFVYSLRSDFTSPSGKPATWAPHNPQHWGQEKARIPIGGEAAALALSHDDKLLAVGIEKNIHIFNVTTRECVVVLKGHPGNVITLRFLPAFDPSYNGRQYLLASQGDEEVHSEINTIILWELDEEGQELHTKATNTELAMGKLRFEGSLGSPGSTIFSHDLKNMVYIVPNMTAVRGWCQYAPSINIWNNEDRSLRYQLFGHTDAISWIGISPNDLLATSLSMDGTARVWDVNEGVCLQVIKPQGGQLCRGAFSPDSKYLAIGSPSALLIYDIATGEPASVVEMPSIHSMAWSPDGSLIAVGLECGTVSLLDTYNGVEKMRWQLGFRDYLMQISAEIRGVQFIDDGKKLVFQILEETVEVYDFETNLKQQFTRGPGIKIAKCPAAEVVCSHDSKFLVVGDFDGELRMWNL
ncbi:hypothetical protein N7490_005415 [Penicillium lividum]|nr:hypothetical protein N7490_005415 [Penicillium lividum]